jgi:hypothetical protein
MNDTKWREVFDVLRGQQANAIFRLKFLDEPEARQISAFYPASRTWTDSSIQPFQNREVEWLEITGSALPEIRVSLQTLGDLPLIEHAGVLRIQGYGPVC